jgi:hypothetical protein
MVAPTPHMVAPTPHMVAPTPHMVAPTAQSPPPFPDDRRCNGGTTLYGMPEWPLSPIPPPIFSSPQATATPLPEHRGGGGGLLSEERVGD